MLEPREALEESSTFRLTAGLPKRIDLTTANQGNPNLLHTKGIYSIEDSVLRYCIAPPGRPRPKEFATNQGDGNTLVVLKMPEQSLPWAMMSNPFRLNRITARPSLSPRSLFFQAGIEGCR